MRATVALVYKTGGDYTLEYVKRIVTSLRRHGAQDIVCLSDDPSVAQFCRHIPLLKNYPGWWSKLELFNLTGKTVYFDLDTIISGDIRPILDFPHKFTMLKGFSTGRGASGVMAWHGDFSYLLHKFHTGHIDAYSWSRHAWGDQDWINHNLGFTADYFQDILPRNYIVSRKLNSVYARRFAKVVCYHGKPRPHETGWQK